MRLCFWGFGTQANLESQNPQMEKTNSCGRPTKIIPKGHQQLIQEVTTSKAQRTTQLSQLTSLFMFQQYKICGSKTESMGLLLD